MYTPSYYTEIYEGKIVFVFSKGPRGRILDCQLATVKKIHTGGDVELWDGRIFEQRIDDYKGLEYRYRSRNQISSGVTIMEQTYQELMTQLRNVTTHIAVARKHHDDMRKALDMCKKKG